MSWVSRRHLKVLETRSFPSVFLLNESTLIGCDVTLLDSTGRVVCLGHAFLLPVAFVKSQSRAIRSSPTIFCSSWQPLVDPQHERLLPQWLNLDHRGIESLFGSCSGFRWQPDSKHAGVAEREILSWRALNSLIEFCRCSAVSKAAHA